MLVAMRSRAGGIIIRIFLLFLAGSFALWGVGDIFRGGNSTSVATVDDDPISAQEFRMALDAQMERLRAYLGESYSPELTKQLGLPRQVLNNLINNRLIQKEAHALGLSVSDKTIAERIRQDPSFQGTSNQFDKVLFEEMLRNNRLTEQAYVAILKEAEASNLLVNLITGVKPLLDPTVDTLYQIRHEQRMADIYTLPASAVIDLPTPTDLQLNEFYKAQSAAFTAPEYRTLSYVTLNPDDVSQSITLSEDSLQKAYEERLDEYRMPTKRVVSQLLFANEQDAKAAYERLNKNEAFDKVAQSAPITNRDSVSLGSLSKQEVMSEAADAVFALKAGDHTRPIHSGFGWHIFYVSKVEPERVRPLEEVKSALQKELAMHEAEESMYKLSAKLEDALAGGQTLEKAAGDLGLKVKTIGPVNFEGQAPDGSAVEVPQLANFLKVAFGLEEKKLSPLTSAENNTSYLVRVDTIIPSRAKALDEVRGAVLDAWQKEERSKRLAALAKEMAEALKQGKQPAALKLTSRSEGPFSRAGNEGDATSQLPEALITELFSVPVGQTTSAHATAEGDYVIGKVTKIIPANATLATDQQRADAKETIRSEVDGQLGNELMEQYLRYLRTKYPVTINDAVLQSLTE